MPLEILVNIKKCSEKKKYNEDIINYQIKDELKNMVKFQYRDLISGEAVETADVRAPRLRTATGEETPLLLSTS
jgi:hypothetical protein